MTQVSWPHTGIAVAHLTQAVRRQAGPELRTGTAAMTQTDMLYDGGFNAAGLFAYSASMWYMPASDSREEPDALWSYSTTRTTFIDHAAYINAGALLLGAFSGLSRVDISLVETSITDHVALGAGSEYVWMGAVAVGRVQVSDSRFTRNGASKPGKGGGVDLGTFASSVEVAFETSEWEENTAQFGPAVKADSGTTTSSYRFRQCMFRCVRLIACPWLGQLN